MLEPEELKFTDTLGSGAFGVVKKAQWKSSTVAVKLLHKVDAKSMKLFLKEIELMCKLRHVSGKIV
jgi:serine/threonine protein kinase